MSAGILGAILTPKQGNLIPDDAVWCADNGCFSAGFPGEDAWLVWLQSLRYARHLCEFAVAPDVVGDAGATLDRSWPWLPKIRALGLPAALVAQDGLEWHWTPWPDFDVLFIGGSTEWKLGRYAAELTAEARSLGKPVHMGRVNSRKRLRIAQHLGCTSVDGTYIAFGPDKNLDRMTRWLAEVAAEHTSVGT